MGAAAKQSEFYLVINDEKVGPVTREDVLSYLKEGKISPSDLIWAEGYADWTEIKNASEFAEAFKVKGAKAPPPIKSASIQKNTSQRIVPKVSEIRKFSIFRSVFRVALAVVILPIVAIFVFAYFIADDYQGKIDREFGNVEKYWRTQGKNKQDANRVQPQFPQQHPYVIKLLEAEVGKLGKLSSLLVRVSGKDGFVNWVVEGNDCIATVTKPHSQHSISFALQQESPSADVHVRISTIKVNGVDCPHEIPSETAICFGMIARGQ